MPTIVCKSKIRALADHCCLSLVVRHHIVVQSPSEKPYALHKAAFPADVDVLLPSDLVLSFSGSVDRVTVASQVIAKSQLATSLVDYFRANASSLGLNTVSSIFTDEQDGLPKMTLTSSRCLPVDLSPRPVHATLIALELEYNWQTVCRSPDTHQEQEAPNNPFSAHLSLPFRTVLDNVIDRFVTWHLVRRYPLIFGLWCQQLDTETTIFPVIIRAVLNIMQRSRNPDFLAKCKRFIKIIKRRHLVSIATTASSLSSYIDTINPEFSLPDSALPQLTDEAALCLSMENLYRNNMPRSQFRAVACTLGGDGTDDEELSQEHYSLYNIGFEETLWHDTSILGSDRKSASMTTRSPELRSPIEAAYFDADGSWDSDIADLDFGCEDEEDRPCWRTYGINPTWNRDANEFHETSLFWEDDQDIAKDIIHPQFRHRRLFLDSERRADFDIAAEPESGLSKHQATNQHDLSADTRSSQAQVEHMFWLESGLPKVLCMPSDLQDAHNEVSIHSYYGNSRQPQLSKARMKHYEFDDDLTGIVPRYTDTFANIYPFYADLDLDSEPEQTTNAKYEDDGADENYNLEDFGVDVDLSCNGNRETDGRNYEGPYEIDVDIVDWADDDVLDLMEF